MVPGVAEDTPQCFYEFLFHWMEKTVVFAVFFTILCKHPQKMTSRTAILSAKNGKDKCLKREYLKEVNGNMSLTVISFNIHCIF